MAILTTINTNKLSCVQVLQQLPSKVERIEHVPMAFEQDDLYTSLKEKFTKELREKTDTTGVSAGAAMMMQLRKAANHHLLHRNQYNETKLWQMAKLMLKVIVIRFFKEKHWFSLVSSVCHCYCHCYNW